MNPFRRLIPSAVMLISIIGVGVIGFTVFEGWSFLEALYMVVITLSTVGFKEVRPLSSAGMILVISMIIVGVATVAYTVGQVVEIIVEGQIIGWRRKRAMEKKIREFKGHYLICGFGRVGHEVAHEFDVEDVPYVVIDGKEETAKELEEKGVPFIIGDITSDEVLEDAGIKNAKGLIASSDSDTSNVFLILSARVANPNLYIIARAASIESATKLKKAGANMVISPYFIAGRRMAAMAIKPVAVQYLETVVHGEHVQLKMREFKAEEGTNIINKTIADSNIKSKSGAMIVAIRKPNGKFNLQPSGHTKIEDGDVLISLGTTEQLTKMEGLIK